MLNTGNIGNLDFEDAGTFIKTLHGARLSERNSPGSHAGHQMPLVGSSFLDDFFKPVTTSRLDGETRCGWRKMASLMRTFCLRFLVVDRSALPRRSWRHFRQDGGTLSSPFQFGCCFKTK